MTAPGSMTLEQVAERLEQLAAHRTPGRPTPVFPVPICEHILLANAAQLLLRLHADSSDERRPYAPRANCWALLDSSFTPPVMVGFVNGDRATAMARVQSMIDARKPRARSFVVRAIHFGEN